MFGLPEKTLVNRDSIPTLALKVACVLGGYCSSHYSLKRVPYSLYLS